MPGSSRSTALRSFATWGADIGNQPRVLLATKTAIAATLAWWLAPLLPFAEEEYSYYAPLGALISMSPTLARSARSGLQAMIGLALGVALGLAGVALIRVGALDVVVLAAIVGVGVLLGGVRQLGAGRSWVAIAGVFVLLPGGSDVQDFTTSYLMDVAFGILVGLLVNIALVPPLFTKRADARLSRLRDDVAARLHSMATALSEHDSDPYLLRERTRELSATVDAVREEVRHAEASRRGNPRARRHDSLRDQNRDRLRALDRTVFFVRDLADVVERSDDREDARLSAGLEDELCDAIHAAAELVATPPNVDVSASRLTAADAALGAIWTALDDRDGAPSAAAPEMTIAENVERIVDASRPFVTSTS